MSGTIGGGPLRRFAEQDKGRARFSVKVPTPQPLPHVERLLAGAVRVDITPPPGLPKAGYSSNAHDGSGFRSRLRANVLHLRCGASSLALVQCDLLGGSSVVQHLVADAVADHTDIPLAGLMMGATHTHAGPGQFSGTDFYNRFASNRGGFDPAWTQFLVDQIAAAVIEAHDTRRPARLAMGSTEVWGSTRNRSLDPHVQNATVSDKRQESQRKFAAINPELHLIRVDSHTGGEAADPADGEAEPIGTAVIFSVHGTGISHHAHEYNADLWAYLVDELGHRIEMSRGARGVVGAMEGTHADMAPALHPGRAGYLEARRIGRQIGSEAADLYERLGASLATHVDLACGFREVNLHGGASIDGVQLPDRPAVGAALVAGAKENLTPVLNAVPPFKAGFPKPFDVNGPQGVKWIIGSKWLQPLVLPLKGFPRLVPVQVLRVGSSAIVGLPFEVTVESGRRIKAAAEAALPADAGIERVVVSSVVNEYFGYVATAEEYSRQYYEGGHTLYGPNTQKFMAAHAARLMGEVAASTSSEPVVSDVGRERSWDLKVHRYLPRPSGRGIGRCALGSPRYIDATGDEDGYWQFRWRDGSPGDLIWHEPMVRIDSSDSVQKSGDDADAWTPALHRGRRADDQGTDLEVRLVGTDAVGWVYEARWHDPAFRGGRLHRFVVLASGSASELSSVAFD